MWYMMNFSLWSHVKQIVKDRTSLFADSRPHVLGAEAVADVSEFRKQALLERIPKDLYWKVAGFSFVVGACMGLFMIRLASTRR